MEGTREQIAESQYRRGFQAFPDPKKSVHFAENKRTTLMVLDIKRRTSIYRKNIVPLFPIYISIKGTAKPASLLALSRLFPCSLCSLKKSQSANSICCCFCSLGEQFFGVNYIGIKGTATGSPVLFGVAFLGLVTVCFSERIGSGQRPDNPFTTESRRGFFQ